jgi:hypothetical protein
VSKHFTTGVPNREMRNAEIPKAGDSFGYRDFGYQELGMSRTLTTGVLKSRNSKSRNVKSRNVKDSIPEVRIPGVGDVKDSHDRNPKVAKCEKPKS